MKAQLFIPGLALCIGVALAQTDQQNMPAQTNPNSSMQSNTTTTAGANSWTGLLVASGCENASNGATAGAGNMNRSTATGTTGSAMTGPALNGSSGSGMNGTSTDVTGGSATGVSQNTTADNGRTTTPSPDMARASAPVQSDTYGAGTKSNTAVNSGTADRTTTEPGASTSVGTDQNFPKSTASAAHESSGTMNRATDSTAEMRRNSSDMARNSTPAGSSQGSWDDAKMTAGQLGPSCHIASSTSSFALRLPDGRLIPFDSASNARIADQVRSRVSGSSTKIFRVVVTGTMNGDTITADSIRL